MNEPYRDTMIVHPSSYARRIIYIRKQEIKHSIFHKN